MRIGLLSLLTACGTVAGKPGGGDTATADDTAPGEDTASPATCADVTDAREVGQPLQRAEDGGEEQYAAITFGAIVRPARVGGAAAAWIQAGQRTGSYDDRPEWSGVYLLGEEEWSEDVLPSSALPRFVAGPTVPAATFTLRETGLTLSFGPEGEGLWFVQQAEEEVEGYYTWRIFESAPADTTQIEHAPLTIENLGYSDMSPADLDGDGFADFVGVGLEPGLNGFLSPVPGLYDVLADSDFTISVSEGNGLGNQFAFADLDGDGYDDIVFQDGSGHDRDLYVKAGPIVADATWTTVDATWSPAAGFDNLGAGPSTQWDDRRFGLERIADVTGDGRDDVLVTATYTDDAGQEDVLTAFLLDRLEPGAHTIDELTALRGLDDVEESLVELGGTGDFDGDGETDVFLKHASEVGGAWAGVVFLGSLVDGVDALERRVAFTAPLEWDRGAFNAGVVGDLDGDGVDSWVFVDKTGYFDPSRAWLVEGCGQTTE